MKNKIFLLLIICLSSITFLTYKHKQKNVVQKIESWRSEDWYEPKPKFEPKIETKPEKPKSPI